MQYPVFITASLLAIAALATTPMAASAQSTKDKIEDKAEKGGDKVKGTMEQAGEKTKAAGDKAKTEVSDSWLTAKAKIALFADERVKGHQIKVETQKGMVMLRGKVDSDGAKAAAESIAQGIEGVKGVKNELQVVAPTARPAVDASDKDIQKAVKQRLAANPQMKKIDVRADAGVVTLTGEVASIDASARASETARAVPGVRSVKNDLTFKQDRRGG